MDGTNFNLPMMQLRNGRKIILLVNDMLDL
jgi:hypothetical protein